VRLTVEDTVSDQSARVVRLSFGTAGDRLAISSVERGSERERTERGIGELGFGQLRGRELKRTNAETRSP